MQADKFGQKPGLNIIPYQSLNIFGDGAIGEMQFLYVIRSHALTKQGSYRVIAERSGFKSAVEAKAAGDAAMERMKESA